MIDGIEEKKTIETVKAYYSKTLKKPEYQNIDNT